MPITKTTGYKASDGQVYATVEEAQASELMTALKPMLQRVFEIGDAARDNGVPFLRNLAAELIDGSDLLLDILTTGPRSRPSTRKKAGTTAPRRARARAATSVEAQEGFKGMREAVDAPLAAVS